MQQTFRRGGRLQLSASVGVVLLSAFGLAACGGSASETPPPIEPVPDRVLPDRESTTAPAGAAPAGTSPAGSGGTSGAGEVTPPTGAPPAF